MKNFVLFLFLVLTGLQALPQTWTAEQWARANTAKDVKCLSTAEKETILYLNLARLYPKLFVTYELKSYTGSENFVDYLLDSEYKESLIKDLNCMKAANALIFDSVLYENARCFATESGEQGITGHTRIQCADLEFAECCSYGMSTGKDVAMQLLVDHGVPTMGHRIVCLSESYSKIGPSIHVHQVWGFCAVVDFL